MVFTHAIDPVLLSLGPFEIRYYGLFYILTFIIGYFVVLRLAKERKINLTKDDVTDLVLYALLGAIIGARLFYVFVYNFASYKSNLLSVFFIWNGGLSFHGGLIGVIVAGFLFAKKKNIHPYDLGDLMVIPAAIGLFLGRLGNFTNAELVGRVTDVSWAFYFPGYDEPRHPSQLYAAFKNIVLVSCLYVLHKKSVPRGVIFWSFGLLYATFRFIVEFFREPDSQLGFVIGTLSMGQVLSIILFIISAGFLIYIFHANKKHK